MTLREAATSIAARVPTQVKLLFATLAYYAVICVVFWQVENWPVLDSIYFATGIMSTVGTGDLFPSEDDGLALVHALTIIFAFSGIVSTKKVSMDEALSMSRRSNDETKSTSMIQALQEAARAASPPPPPLAEDVDVSFKTSTPASIHPAPASAAEPAQAMSMDERLSRARHSQGPSLTSLTSPRVMRPEDI